jgi:hypothetical protein
MDIVVWATGQLPVRGEQGFSNVHALSQGHYFILATRFEETMISKMQPYVKER